MKIGIDASRYLSEESTGVEWYSYYIINGLIKLFAKSEHDLLLYSRTPMNFKTMGVTENIQNIVLPSKRFWTLLRLSKEMKDNPPDKLFVPSHVLPLQLPEKSVIMIHDVAFKYFKNLYSPIQYKYLNWSSRRAVQKSTRIITPSMATKKDLIKFYNCDESKIQVIYHGFTPPKFTDKEIDEVSDSSDMINFFSISKFTPYFLFVGRLESKKNIKNTLKAFSIFLKTNPNYKFVLAGKRGVGIKQIVKTLHELNLEDKVIMPGYITEKEKAYLYKNCRAFVFTSFYEGFGLPLLESFYYSKPVICSNTSSLPEVCGNACIYVDPHSVSSISSAMQSLADNLKLEEDLKEKGRLRLQKFNWENSAKKTFELLLNC